MLRAAVGLLVGGREVGIPDAPPESPAVQLTARGPRLEDSADLKDRWKEKAPPHRLGVVGMQK